MSVLWDVILTVINRSTHVGSLTYHVRRALREKSPENARESNFGATPARSVGSLRKLLSADFYGSLVDLGLQLLWRIAECFLPKVSVRSAEMFGIQLGIET